MKHDLKRLEDKRVSLVFYTHPDRCISEALLFGELLVQFMLYTLHDFFAPI